MLAALFRHIWLETNNRVFSEKYLSVTSTYHRINNSVDLWAAHEQIAQEQPENSKQQRRDPRRWLALISLAAQGDEERQEDDNLKGQEAEEERPL